MWERFITWLGRAEREEQHWWLRYRIGCDLYTGSFEEALDKEWCRNEEAKREGVRVIVREELMKLGFVLEGGKS